VVWSVDLQLREAIYRVSGRASGAEGRRAAGNYLLYGTEVTLWPAVGLQNQSGDRKLVSGRADTSDCCRVVVAKAKGKKNRRKQLSQRVRCATVGPSSRTSQPDQPVRPHLHSQLYLQGLCCTTYATTSPAYRFLCFCSQQIQSNVVSKAQLGAIHHGMVMMSPIIMSASKLTVDKG